MDWKQEKPVAMSTSGIRLWFLKEIRNSWKKKKWLIPGLEKGLYKPDHLVPE